MWQKLASLAALGALGTLARYFLDGLVIAWLGNRFPWGILVVNLLGCFCFGLIYPPTSERLVVSAETRLLILTGFMGAFTTYSTFTFQTAALMRDSQWMLAAANVAAQVVLGLVCMFAGLAIGSRL